MIEMTFNMIMHTDHPETSRPHKNLTGPSYIIPAVAMSCCNTLTPSADMPHQTESGGGVVSAVGKARCASPSERHARHGADLGDGGRPWARLINNDVRCMRDLASLTAVVHLSRSTFHVRTLRTKSCSIYLPFSIKLQINRPLVVYLLLTGIARIITDLKLPTGAKEKPRASSVSALH